ncbi:MAG: hypothetical protein R6U19_10770 [Bacteroidales bacterium]
MGTLNRLIICFSFLCFVFLWGCEVIDPEDPVPSYIYIEDIQTHTKTGQGTDKQQFSDAWVYLNHDLVGAFELPAMVPVIAEGENLISIKPGIKLNGISSTRASYPFMKQYETTVALQKEKIDTLDVDVSYFDAVEFPWGTHGQEDFEQSGISLDSTPDSDAMIIRQTHTVFEGQMAGHIELDSAGAVFYIESTHEFDYPGQNAQTFLEIHYKANNSFTVGLKMYNYTGTITQNPIVNVNPKNHWNKMYINLTPPLSRKPETSKYKVYLSGNINTDEEKGDFYFDNIKLVQKN